MTDYDMPFNQIIRFCLLKILPLDFSKCKALYDLFTMGIAGPLYDEAEFKKDKNDFSDSLFFGFPKYLDELKTFNFSIQKPEKSQRKKLFILINKYFSNNKIYEGLKLINLTDELSKNVVSLQQSPYLKYFERLKGFLNEENNERFYENVKNRINTANQNLDFSTQIGYDISYIPSKIISKDNLIFLDFYNDNIIKKKGSFSTNEKNIINTMIPLKVIDQIIQSNIVTNYNMDLGYSFTFNPTFSFIKDDIKTKSSIDLTKLINIKPILDIQTEYTTKLNNIGDANRLFNFTGSFNYTDLALADGIIEHNIDEITKIKEYFIKEKNIAVNKLITRSNFVGLVSFIKMLFEESIDINLLKFIAYNIIDRKLQSILNALGPKDGGRTHNQLTSIENGLKALIGPKELNGLFVDSREARNTPICSDGETLSFNDNHENKLELVFIYFMLIRNYTPTKQQIRYIYEFNEMMFNNKRKRVVEFLMGGGKTDVITPILNLYALDNILKNCEDDKETDINIRKGFIVNTMPQVLINEAIEKFYTLSYHSFPFKLHNISVKLQDNPIKETLEYDPINLKPTIIFLNDRSLESLKLNVESFNHFDHNEYKNNLGFPSKIKTILDKVDKSTLTKAMDRAFLFVDEFDNLADPIKSELNYPIGIQRNIQEQEFTISLCMNISKFLLDRNSKADIRSKISRSVLTKTDFNNILEFYNVTGTRGHLLLRSTTNKKLNYAIKIAIIKKLKELDPTQIDLYEILKKKITSDYTDIQAEKTRLITEINTTVDFIESNINKIRIAYHIINNLITSILSKRYRVNFGLKYNLDDIPVNDSQFNLLAVPYEYALTPSKNSLFTDVYLTIILTCMSFFLDKKLRSNDLDLWLYQLKDRFLNTLGYINSEDTVSNQFLRQFNDTFGNFQLKSGTIVNTELLNIIYSIPNSKKGALELFNSAIAKTFSEDPANIETYLTSIIFNAECKERSTQFNLSFIDIFSASFCQNRVGYTGTASKFIPIENNKLKMYEFDSNYCKDVPGEESINEALVEHCEEIKVFRDDNFINDVTGIIGSFNALVDVGALLLDQDKERFPRLFYQAFGGAQGVNSSKDIIYWQGEDRFYINKSGDRDKKLNKKADIDNFVFYDNEHITGTDYPHMSNAKAIITINSDTRLRDVAQGVYRMRGINLSQRIVYAMTTITWAKFIRDYSTDFRRLDGKAGFTGTNDELLSNPLRKEFIMFCFKQIEEEYRQKQDYLYKLQVHRNYFRQEEGINILPLDNSIDYQLTFGNTMKEYMESISFYNSSTQTFNSNIQKFIVPITVNQINYNSVEPFKKISFNTSDLFNKINDVILKEEDKFILTPLGDWACNYESSTGDDVIAEATASATSVAQSSSMSVSLSLSLTQKYNVTLDLDKAKLVFDNDILNYDPAIISAEVTNPTINVNRVKDSNLIHEINYESYAQKQCRLFRTKGTILHNRYFNIISEFYVSDISANIYLISGEEFVQLISRNINRNLNYFTERPKHLCDTPDNVQMKDVYYYFKLLQNIPISKQQAIDNIAPADSHLITMIQNTKIYYDLPESSNKLKHNIIDSMSQIYIKDGSYLPLLPPYCAIFDKSKINEIRNWSDSGVTNKITYFRWKYDNNINNNTAYCEIDNDYKLEEDLIDSVQRKYIKLFSNVNTKYYAHFTGPDNNTIKIFKNKYYHK